jgi:hypothetical protein
MRLPRDTRIALAVMLFLLLALAILAWLGHDTWQQPEGYP